MLQDNFLKQNEQNKLFPLMGNDILMSTKSKMCGTDCVKCSCIDVGHRYNASQSVYTHFVEMKLSSCTELTEVCAHRGQVRARLALFLPLGCFHKCYLQPHLAAQLYKQISQRDRSVIREERPVQSCGAERARHLPCLQSCRAGQ